MSAAAKTARCACVLILLVVMLAATAAVMAADDATQDDAPPRPTVPTAAAEVAGPTVAFREVPGGVLNSANSALPVAADEALWRHSKGLPNGARIRLQVSAASLPADGHSAMHLTVILEDRDGHPITSLTRARIEVSLGRLRSPTGAQAAAFEIALPHGVAELDLLAPATAGEALVRVSSGAVRVQGQVSFLPELRPLIAVGVVETGLAFQHVNADANAPMLTHLSFEDSLRHWGNDPSNGCFWSAGGRAAGFIKGTIGADTLLTGAYDSNKIDPRRFFADVDPNQFFPVAGDASLVNYDARSASKLFLRLDRGPSHMLYGDFQTLAPTDTAWLGSYARTLTGFTAHYETAKVRATVFAAQETTHQFIDEQPGRGISGPYAVSQANAVANSETIQILVRDRNQPSIVLSRRTLTRYADYDFEPFSGRLLFRQPVAGADENLNPVSIRITYEVDNGGAEHVVDGINAEFLVRENLMVGARYSQDHDPVTEFKLFGVNSVWRLNATTTLTVDVARSEGNQLESVNAGGTLTPVSVSPAVTTANPSGNAGRIELDHRDDSLDARVYASKTDADFENASASLSPGRTEAGAHATYRLTERTQLVVDALRSVDEPTNAHRTGAAANIETRVWNGAQLATGVSYVNQSYNAALPAVAQYVIGAVPGTATGAPLNNTGFGFAGGGALSPSLSGPLALPMTGAASIVEQDYLAADVKLTQKVTDDASVYAQYAHAVDGGDGQLAAIGGEYRVTDAQRFYARYEDIDSLTGNYGLGDGARARQLVVGFDSAYRRDGTVYNEYRLAGTASGQSAADALGIRNLWRIAPGLDVTTSLERQQVIEPAPLPDAPAGTLIGSQSATAVALGADYLASRLWKSSARLEYRFSDVEKDWLSTLALLRKLSDSWSLMGRNLYLGTRTRLPGQPRAETAQDRLQLGMAYRDSVTNLWNALFRYEYRTDYNNAPLIGADSRSQILALIANFHPVRAWEFEAQLAGKDVRENLAGVHSDYSAVLVGARAVWDLSPRWDVGLLASTTTGGGSHDQGAAFEVGYRVIDNLWLSGGCVAGRYADTELFSADSSWTGVYVRVRFKFDETSFQRGDPQANRSLAGAATSPRQ